MKSPTLAPLGCHGNLTAPIIVDLELRIHCKPTPETLKETFTDVTAYGVQEIDATVFYTDAAPLGLKKREFDIRNWFVT